MEIFHPTTLDCYGRGEQTIGALAKAVGDQRQRGETKERKERRITGEEAWTALETCVARSVVVCVVNFKSVIRKNC